MMGHRPFLLACLLGLAVSTPTAWVLAEGDGGGTTMFQEPPSPAEILEALGEKPKIKYRGIKTRSIRILDTADAEPAQPQKPAESTKSAPKVAASKPASGKSQSKLALQLNFETGSSVLTADAKRYVDNIASAMKGSPNMSMHISGHTDITGSTEVNERLSRQRAEAVKAYLTGQHHIDAARLTFSGEGAKHLLLKDKPTAPENRRVEFVKL